MSPSACIGAFSLISTPAGAFRAPDGLPDADAIPAPVPGTVAEALAAAGCFDRNDPTPLHDDDHWYLAPLSGEGRFRLVFDGLATFCDVYLDGERIAATKNMFVQHTCNVSLSGTHRLALCFRALRPELGKKGPRARWRPQMIPNQGLRLVRTTLLGHMPGWCPSIEAIGPYRPIRIEALDRPVVRRARITPDFDGKGSLDVELEIEGAAGNASLSCAGGTTVLTSDDGKTFSGRLDSLDVEPWWPATHGGQPLYPVSLTVGDTTLDLGRTGFRRIEADRGEDGKGFGLRVNGTPVFCRGACWTNADILSLAGARQNYEPFLRLAAEAGMNMIRVGGTMLYESPDFFALCDELGLMVWQEFVFANFDYPVRDPDFVAEVQREAESVLTSIAGSPSLAVLCGGSEAMQQGAMMGLPESAWRSPLFTDILAGAAARLRPDVPYVENSPSGGALPFLPNEGVGHYYGVGAYMRPLEDARRANVRFAAESLAFANVPDEVSLKTTLNVPAVHHPRWKAGVPRDLGASWDFEDVRDHYLALLYEVDPARLRREDPVRYLDLSRAVSAEVMAATFDEWRRAGSSCAGALVWTLQDLAAGAGWGIICSDRNPKPAWHGLKTAFQPIRVILTDEGTNGLAIHLVNETPEAIETTVSLTALREGRQPVLSAKKDMELPPRSVQSINAFELTGAFFDLTYAYRFGPPSHDAVVAGLSGPDGMLLSQTVHFPLGRGNARHDLGLEATLIEDGGYWLEISTARLAQSVHIVDEHFRGEAEWFHLPPVAPRRIRLLPRANAPEGARPSGELIAVNGLRGARYGG
ncbi:Beta-mannosidase B [Hartmannibacter diazotrophicus]|uniref:Beta-mannosidase B n=1 Tax=Hartmannibacter diazotrophicus TaxID=1482074 RepID=A0A2C9DAZ9_9HYPH|nr:glycoside hydrolase family 2 protein [Hartmannibacter diazotrophicus]SON57467.1 Beta-mannosidase B [Hartmannibacter diazotrophicus]